MGIGLETHCQRHRWSLRRRFPGSTGKMPLAIRNSRGGSSLVESSGICVSGGCNTQKKRVVAVDLAEGTTPMESNTKRTPPRGDHFILIEPASWCLLIILIKPLSHSTETTEDRPVPTKRCLVLLGLQRDAVSAKRDSRVSKKRRMNFLSKKLIVACPSRRIGRALLSNCPIP